MKVWIVNVNEPLPTDPGNNRPWRMGQVFQMLRQRGHDVTWWSSTMDHFAKAQRHHAVTEIPVDQEARVIHLHGRHYHKNISLQRLLNHRTLGRQFRELAPRRPRPDIILASIPILDLPREAVRFGGFHEVPVVIDIRDKWPDFMVDQVPAFAKPLARLILRPMFNDLHESTSRAAGLFGVTPGFLQWGLRAAGREGNIVDEFFPHAYPETVIKTGLLAEAGKFWDNLGITEDSSQPTLCFIGSLNFTAFDFQGMLEGLGQLDRPVRLVICGAGQGESKLKEMARGLAEVVFAGWVDEPALRVIMQRAWAGVAPYRNSSNFSENLPNKFLEYLSQSLPVISCLAGYSRQILEPSGAACFYREGNPADFAATVGALLDDDARYQTMRQAAGNLFREHFRAEIVYGKLIDRLELVSASS